MQKASHFVLLTHTFNSSSNSMDTTRLLFCLCLLFTPLCQGNEKTVGLNYINSAVKVGAVCLDGTPPAYQFDRGVGRDAHKWIVFLEGGGMCPTAENCLDRSKDYLGSSKMMHPVNFTGILSDSQHLNPYFYNWNRVLVRYCDGAEFTGNRYDSVHKLHYKGAKIFDAVVKVLLDKGMANATFVLLHGCSAGGTAAILNCDKFRSFLPKHTAVKCSSDAGYFIHTKDVFGEYNFQKLFIHGVAKLHGSVENLPKSCTSKMKPKSMCLNPQYVLPHVESPVFITNSAFDRFEIQYILAPLLKKLPPSWERCRNDTRTCSADQIETLKGFRLAFLRALPRVGNASFRGTFITSEVHSSLLVYSIAGVNMMYQTRAGIRNFEMSKRCGCVYIIVYIY